MVMLHARVVKSAGNDGKTEAPGEKKNERLAADKQRHMPDKQLNTADNMPKLPTN